MDSSDVVVLGGGVIGLSLAWELAERGAHVTLFERNEPGGAASWAAAGMLAPYTEDIRDAEFRELAIASLRAYPSFATRLAAASDVDVHLRLHGIVELAYSEAEAYKLDERVARQGAEDGTRQLDERELFTLDPALARGALRALLHAEEGQVDNRRLGRALSEAARRAGVRIRTRCDVRRVEANARRVLGVDCSDGFVAAASVVNALGAWAGEIPGVPAHCVVPVVPVKGQMLALAMPRGYVRRVVWGGGVYCVPREDGRLLVGATVERQSYDTRVTAAGVAHLLAGVQRVLPGAASFALSETWAGLRPDTPDGRPFLGATSLEGYYLATGHYRNGVLLTPVTAQIVADAVEGKPGADAAFTLARLGRGVPTAVANPPV